MPPLVVPNNGSSHFNSPVLIFVAGKIAMGIIAEPRVSLGTGQKHLSCVKNISLAAMHDGVVFILHVRSAHRGVGKRGS
jgi:hypothetical protein